MSTLNTAKKEKWRFLVEEQVKSGLSQTQFCREKKISVGRFGYYRRCLMSAQEKKPTKAPLFSAVHVKDSFNKKPAEIRIVLPNGFQCVVPDNVDPPHLKCLMGVLLSC